MKITLVAAISKDGFITKGYDPKQMKWTTAEDKEFLSSLVNKHQLLVMGRNTYEASSKKLSPDHLKVILTKNPGRYKENETSGLLEFYSLTPNQFVNKFKKYPNCLVLGGSYVFTSFLEAGLIEEIYLTIEPVDHESGIPLLKDGKKLDEVVKLPKPEITQLNKTGTKLYHYVLKN